MTISFAAPTIAVALAALTTLATIATIGIAFLSQPGRATLYWSFAFTLTMTATFATSGGEVGGWEVTRVVGLGALLGAPALLWSGFRAHWGERPYVWIGGVVAAGSALWLALTAGTPAYPLAFRSVFLVGSLFGAVFFIDWVRVRARREAITIPLAVVSLLFAALGVGFFISWSLMWPGAAGDLAFARLVSSIGMLVYVVCAAVAVVGVSTRAARDDRRSAAVGNWATFESSAHGRLHAASRSAESLSLVYLRLDDMTEIRQAAGAGAVQKLTAQFVRETREVFPAGSLVDSPAPGVAVTLTPAGEAIVRSSLSILLQRITDLKVDGRLPIRPSASVGWAPTSVLGFELDTLLYMGREAAAVAAEAGGDRWERVGVTVTNRILSHSARP